MDIVTTHRFRFRRPGLNRRVWERPHIHVVFMDYYTDIQKPLRWHLNGLHLYADLQKITFAVRHTDAISK